MIERLPHVTDVAQFRSLADRIFNTDRKQSHALARMILQRIPKTTKSWEEYELINVFYNPSISLSPIEKQKLARSEEAGAFLTWAARQEYFLNRDNIRRFLEPQRAGVMGREEQAVATEVLTANRGEILPADVAGHVGSFLGDQKPNQYKSLQDIRDAERRPTDLQEDATAVMHSQRDMMRYEDQTQARLQRYRAEEQAFLTAHPGGDFKAAFAAKHPDWKDWLDQMVRAGNIH